MKKTIRTFRSGYLLSMQLSGDGLLGCSVRDGKLELMQRVVFDPLRSLSDNLTEAAADGRLPEPSGANVTVSLDTDRVCLVPSVFCNPADAASHLAVNGVPYGEGDELLVSAETGGAVAVMAFDGSACRLLRERYGDVAFTHPLLSTLADTAPDAVIRVVLSRESAHLTAFSGHLLYAGTVPCRTETDLLFVLDGIRKLFPREDFRVTLSGPMPDGLTRTLSRHFRRVAAAVPAVSGREAKRKDLYEYAPLIQLCYENN